MEKGKIMKYRFTLLIVLACICSVLAEAKVKLPSVLSDGMVLQRERPIKIWGTADPGENVVVTFKKKKYTAVADENGKWLVTLPAMKAGGPYELTVNEVTVKDILIGDVWLCSGQSNMELTVARVADMFGKETATYENSMVRYVKTPYGNDLHGPKEDISQMNWTALNPQVAQSYAALPYFFAIEMYNETKVPVGIINSSWGGSSIEAWMSEDALQAFPKNLRERDIYNSDEYKALMNKAGGMMSRFWNLSLYKGDEGLHAPVKWYEPELNDSDWEEVNMFSYQLGSKDGYPVSGSHWFRQNIPLAAEQADKDAILRLGCMVNADSVYVNGVFVGTTSYQYPPRIYKVPASVLKAGENLVTVRLINSGGRPSFVKGKPYCMAIDGDTVRLSEQWKYRLGCEMPAGRGGVSFQNIPTGMYNSMISPLRNLTFKGALWYQGESNTGDYAMRYGDELKAMIELWRGKWHQPDMPFLIVQLPKFGIDAIEDGGWPLIREQEWRVADELEHVAAVVTLDAGESNDLHPHDKKTIADRAFNVAMDFVYGQQAQPQPVVETAEADDGLLRMHCVWRNSMGEQMQSQNRHLMTLDGDVPREIDFLWHDCATSVRAEAWLDGCDIVARIPSRMPDEVRYAWSNSPESGLICDGDGVLLPPFHLPLPMVD